MEKKKSNKFVKVAIGNLVAIPLIGASAGMANTLPAGTAKTIVKVVPGLQSVALLGPNLKLIKSKPKRNKQHW